MKKPKKRDAEKTLARIIDSALTLFASDGYAGTSMRAIAGKTGIEAATLYHYFPSKEEIIKSIFSKFYLELAGAYKKILFELPKLENDRKRFAFFLREHHAFLSLHARFAFLFYLEGIRPGSPLYLSMDKHTGESSGLLKAMAATFTGLKPDEAALLLMAGVGMNTFLLSGAPYIGRILGTEPTPEALKSLQTFFGL